MKLTNGRTPKPRLKNVLKLADSARIIPQRGSLFNKFPGLNFDYSYSKDFLAYYGRLFGNVAPPRDPDPNPDDAIEEEEYDSIVDYDPDMYSGGKQVSDPMDHYDPGSPFAALQALKSIWIVNPTLRPAQIRRPGPADLDTSTTILSSIIINITDDTHGYAVTTGDGIGHRIHEKCIVPWQEELKPKGQGTGATNKPYLNTLKVPHHGSVKNNQLDKAIVFIEKLPRGTKIAEDVSLRELLELLCRAIMPDLPEIFSLIDFLRKSR
ncbi:MAG: hypothetical protein LQ351_000004 [Letrouitia transgressa]|nr:MAG: hypothetical protein LQ351_000004 [Letrouitia transgressa]